MLGLLATILGHGPTRGAFKGALHGGNIWWVARNYKDASEVIWPQLKRALNDICTAQADMRIELPGGGSVTVRSAHDPDSLRGVGLDGLVMDEVAFFEERAWTEALRPTLADRQGWAVFISTPDGPNWFADLFNRVPSDPGWERWQRPTSDNPLIPDAELLEAERNSGQRAFAQEYLAQFVDMAGAEFPGSYFGEQVWFDEWPKRSEIKWRVMALDPSKGKTEKSDYSAYIMLALHESGVMYCDADISRRDVWTIVEDGVRLSQSFEPHAFGVEVNQFQEMLVRPFEEAMLAKGILLPIHTINNTLSKRIRLRATLTPFLARGEIRFLRGSPGARLLLKQLQAFPLDKYDDGPDALEMAVNLTRHIFRNGVDGNQ